MYFGVVQPLRVRACAVAAFRSSIAGGTNGRRHACRVRALAVECLVRLSVCVRACVGACVSVAPTMATPWWLGGDVCIRHLRHRRGVHLGAHLHAPVAARLPHSARPLDARPGQREARIGVQRRPEGAMAVRVCCVAPSELLLRLLLLLRRRREGSVGCPSRHHRNPHALDSGSIALPSLVSPSRRCRPRTTCTTPATSGSTTKCYTAR